MISFLRSELLFIVPPGFHKIAKLKAPNKPLILLILQWLWSPQWTKRCFTSTNFSKVMGGGGRGHPQNIQTFPLCHGTLLMDPTTPLSIQLNASQYIDSVVSYTNVICIIVCSVCSICSVCRIMYLCSGCGWVMSLISCRSVFEKGIHCLT